MQILTITDFFHGENADGSSRKFVKGTSYNVPEDVPALDAGIMLGAGWAIRLAPAAAPMTRLSVEPVDVTFNPAQ